MCLNFEKLCIFRKIVRIMESVASVATKILRLGVALAVLVCVAGCRCSSGGDAGGSAKASKVPEVLAEVGFEKLSFKDVDWSRYTWEYGEGPEWIDVKDGPLDVALEEGDVVVFPYKGGRRLMVVASVSPMDDEGKWVVVQGVQRYLFEGLYEYAEKEFKDRLE